MTLFSNAILESAPNTAVPALRVSTKYMESFLPLRPVSSGTEIHTHLNSSGALDIYSVGSDARVYRLRRSRGQTAPFDEVDLGISASQLYLFEAAGANPDQPSIFGLDGRGKLTLSTWQNGAYGQRNTGPDQDVIRRFCGMRSVTGRIHINVRLDDGRLGTNFYDPQTDKWGGLVWAPVEGPDGKEAVVKEITAVTNNPDQWVLFAIGMDDQVLFSDGNTRASKLVKLNKKATHIAAITDADALLNVFAVELDTGLLWLKKQRKYSTGGIQFEDWMRVDPDQRAALGRVQANIRRDNLVEVFALDEAGDLLYTRQSTDSKGKVTGWQPLFPIAAQRSSAIFTLGRNANGYSEAFSVNSDNKIYHFWQAPETGQWYSEALDTPSVEEKLISTPTHATEFFVVDESGAPVQNAEVTINTAFLTTIWVDGTAYSSSIVDPVRLKTDLTGKLVVLQRANALAGATMLVSTLLTPAGQPIKVEPNAQLQSKLAGIGKADILDARDKEGNLLLPADIKDRDKVAESIAAITQSSMDIAQADEKASPLQFKFASKYATGFRLESDFTSLGEMAWEIDFGSGVPIYSKQTLASVKSFRAEHAHLLTVGGSFLGIDWGSVWNGIKDGVRWVIEGLEKIVVSVVDGIATVLFKIAGKVFEAVIRFAQQALDFVEGVWNWLKVKLKQLYEWLAFLFNFKDYVHTADGVKHTIGVLLDFTADAVGTIRDRVDAGFESIKGNLEGIVDQLVSNLNGQGEPSLGTYFNQEPASEEQQNAADHNIFLNAYQQNQSAIKLTNGGTGMMSDELVEGLDGLMDKLKSLADNFQFEDGKQAFEDAYGYFNNIGRDPNRALQLLLSGVVKVLKGVALFALDFAKGVVDSILDLLELVIRAFRDAIFEAWEIPVFSQLYELFTGDKLTITPVDVIAWLVAIPMTIGSKIILGRTPWTEEELKRFEQTFTTDMLKRRIGIGSATASELVAADDWDPRWRENFLTSYCFVMALRALGEPGGIMANARGEGLGPAGIVPVALRFLSTCFTAPWALSAAAGAPNCKPGDPGFGVTIWICQMVFGPVRGGLLHYQKVIQGQPKIYTAELTLTLWGVAHLVMQAWHFGKQEKNRLNNLAFSRAILNLVPGQTLHFLALPVLNQETDSIPAGILAALSFVAFFGSMGVAICEIHTVPE